jgi:RHS repeat-associated protein
MAGVTQALSWDGENRLTSVTQGGVTYAYTYDGDGNRVKVSTGGVVTAYVGSYFEILPATGVTTTYYYLGSQRVAMRTASGVTWLAGDHLGSTSLATSSAGAKVSEERYLPYGGTRSGSAPTDYQFTGQRNDTSTGLYYYGARYYDPVTGRFVSADTVGFEPGNPQDLNRFGYVRNNPVKYTDPTGHMVGCGAGDDTCGAAPSYVPAPPSEPPVPAGPLAAFLRSFMDGDYHSAAVNVNVGYPVMLFGAGISMAGQPEAGLPIALTGGALALTNWSVGFAFTWNEYGDTWFVPTLSWGKVWGGAPASVDLVSGHIDTGRAERATRDETRDFLTGPAVSVSAAAVLGGGITLSPGAQRKLSIDLHALSLPPQLGATLGWGFPLTSQWK